MRLVKKSFKLLACHSLCSQIDEHQVIVGAARYKVNALVKQREIADSVGAYLMVDMAHIAGLVAAGCHANPVPYADVVRQGCLYVRRK